MTREAPVFPRPLRREIIVLVALKLAALVVIQQLFFAPHRADVSAGAVATHLTSPPAPLSDHGE